MKEDVKTVIILDGTWDQAKKMFVRSPDLHKVKRLQLALRYRVYLFSTLDSLGPTNSGSIESSVSFWVSRIRIVKYLYGFGSRSFYLRSKKIMKNLDFYTFVTLITFYFG
jgi:hypothetical protein